jgi:hypothetical protein
MSRLKFVIPLTLIFFAASFLPGQIFIIKHIECSYSGQSCPQSVLDLLLPLANKSLLFTPDAALTNHPLVKSFQITKRFPSTLTVSIQARIPVAVANAGSEHVLVDEQGVAISFADSQELPHITIEKLPQLGESAGSRFQSALAILTQPELVNLHPIQSRLVGTLLTINPNSPPTIMIDISAPQKNWQYTLQSVINRSRINGNSPRTIDLRYQSPIVTY